MLNRKQRRHDPKYKKRYSLVDVQRAMNIAITMKRVNKGHLFSRTQKNRCVFCGVTTKTKKTCQYWFMSFMDRTQSVLINPDFYTDDNTEALWLQNSKEYQNIKLPLNVTKV